MKFTDCAAYEVDCPDHDQSEGQSTSVRICALSELLHGDLQSGAMNQCAIDESLYMRHWKSGRSARGRHLRMGATSWGKVDGSRPITHAAKYGRGRDMDFEPRYFFAPPMIQIPPGDGAKYASI